MKNCLDYKRKILKVVFVISCCVSVYLANQYEMWSLYRLLYAGIGVFSLVCLYVLYLLKLGESMGENITESIDCRCGKRYHSMKEWSSHFEERKPKSTDGQLNYMREHYPVKHNKEYVNQSW